MAKMWNRCDTKNEPSDARGYGGLAPELIAKAGPPLRCVPEKGSVTTLGVYFLKTKHRSRESKA